MNAQAPAQTDQTRPAYRRPAEVARLFFPSSRGDCPVHPATVTKYITNGLPLRDGSILKLKAKRFPGCWGVRDEDVEEFVNALTADHLGEPPPVVVRDTAARERAAEKAARECIAAGL